jgi:hypothetical protein
MILDPTFRPFKHKIRDSCKAKFASAFLTSSESNLESKSQEYLAAPTWFFRYDSNYLEIRQIENCIEFASLSISINDIPMAKQVCDT